MEAETLTMLIAVHVEDARQIGCVHIARENGLLPRCGARPQKAKWQAFIGGPDCALCCELAGVPILRQTKLELFAK
jgi:hypothetical protein